MESKNAAKFYQIVSAQTSVEDASPHKLVQILMENTLDKLAKAKGFMLSNNIHDKGVSISMALASIEVLQSSLDKEKGEVISENLFNLYDYMMRSLIEANLNNNSEKIDEVIRLLTTVKEGWDLIENHEK